MASLNHVILLGKLGRDPELRYTPKGTAVVQLSVATDESWKDANGNIQKKTEWHRVNVWGKQAENCAKYLTKGQLVHVVGRLETRTWDDQATGVKRYSTEIKAEEVGFHFQKTSGGAPGSGTDTAEADSVSKDTDDFSEVPF